MLDMNKSQVAALWLASGLSVSHDKIGDVPWAQS